MLTKENKLGKLEICIVFLSILFKYLINIHLKRRFLYAFLALIVLATCFLFFYKKINRRQIIRLLMLVLVTAFFTIVYADANFLISLILAIVCINKEDESYIKVFFWSSLILYILTIISNLLGIIPSHNMYRATETGYKVRYSLGFTHPNEVFLYFLPIVLTAYYLYGNKRLFILLTLIASMILYFLSWCRAGIAVIAILLVLDFLTRKNSELKFLNKVVPFLFVIFTILSIVLSIKFGDNLTNAVSSSLNGRPYYWNYYIKNNSLISFFGKNKVEGYFLDNFYIYMLVQLGIVGYIIYFLIYYKSLTKMKLDKRYSIIVLIFLIYGLFEANVIIGSIAFLFALQLKDIIINGGENAQSIQKEKISY